jgi:VanZ family protein
MAKPYFNLKWLTIATLFTAIVVLLTHIPQEIMPSGLQVSGLDKFAHALAYGAITILFVVSLRARPSLLSAAVLFFAISVVGALDELTQPFVHRTASLTDWLADVTGIFVVFVFKTVQSFSNHRQAKTTNLTAISEN